MPKENAKVVEKLKKHYDLSGMSQEEFIAFLLSLLHKILRRRRRKGAKKPKVSGNVAGPTVSGRTIESDSKTNKDIEADLKANKDAELKFYQVNRQPIPKDLLPAPTPTPAPTPAPGVPKLPAPPIPPKPKRKYPVVITPEGLEFPINRFDYKDAAGKTKSAFATDELKEYGTKVVEDATKKAALAAEREAKEKILEQKLNTFKNANYRDSHGLARMTANAILAIPHNAKYRNKKALMPLIEAYAKAHFPNDKNKAKEVYEDTEYDGVVARLGQAGALGKDFQEDYKGKSRDLLQDKELALRKELGIEDKPIVQKGGGKALPEELNNVQIDQVMKKYPGYLGTIAHDQIKTLLPFVRPHQDMGFIINTDKLGQPGTHWQAWFISPDRDREIDYYDSFGRDPDEKIMPDIHALIKKLSLPHHLKLKINRVDEQNADSDNCGYFCIKFLVDRFRGDSFKKATGFPHDEKELERWKKVFPPFRYLDV